MKKGNNYLKLKKMNKSRIYFLNQTHPRLLIYLLILIMNITFHAKYEDKILYSIIITVLFTQERAHYPFVSVYFSYPSKNIKAIRLMTKKINYNFECGGS